MMRIFVSRFGSALASPKTWQEMVRNVKLPTNAPSSFRNFRNLMICSRLNGQVSSETHKPTVYGSSILAHYLRHNSRSFMKSRMLRSSDGPGNSSAVSSSLSSTNGFVKWYLEMIDKYPILTKSITAGTIFTAADLTSQVITSTGLDTLDKLGLDIPRTLRMTGYGLFLSGPTLHLWFNFLSKIIPNRDVLSTAKKMVLGQTLYGPAITVVFFSLNAYLQGENGSEIWARLKRDMIPTVRSGLMYWPLCDFITYKYVPVRLQPLVSNSFSFIWTVYLTYMASLKKVNVEEKSVS